MPPNQFCDSAALMKANEHHEIQHKRYEKELHIAPMLHYSTREFRQLLRILSKRVIVWTEMVVDDTIKNAHNLDAHLGYDIEQHPIVCQIGGNSPELCGSATSVVLEQYNYDEINLNIDCPSERVSGKREFGAVLMKKAELAYKIISEMQSNAAKKNSNDGEIITNKVSVKCRIGVDELDDLDFAAGFIRTLKPVCKRFYLHARKCVLDGLMNARQNRNVPALNYQRVYELCRLFPDCEFWINGGIKTLKEAKLIAYGRREVDGSSSNNENQQHMVPCQLCGLPNGSCIEPPFISPDNLRGCMMGRAAIDNPCLFYDVDRYFYGEKSNPCRNRGEVLNRYCQYLEQRYPRRCCGDGDSARNRYCTICIGVYGPSECSDSDTSTLILDFTTTTDNNKDKSKKPKYTGPTMARCLKPVQGMFSGIPDTRVWRRVCDTLGQDKRIRNCGPAYVIRRAMQSIPREILDQDFG